MAVINFAGTEDASSLILKFVLITNFILLIEKKIGQQFTVFNKRLLQKKMRISMQNQFSIKLIFFRYSKKNIILVT